MYRMGTVVKLDQGGSVAIEGDLNDLKTGDTSEFATRPEIALKSPWTPRFVP